MLRIPRTLLSSTCATASCFRLSRLAYRKRGMAQHPCPYFRPRKTLPQNNRSVLFQFRGEASANKFVGKKSAAAHRAHYKSIKISTDKNSFLACVKCPWMFTTFYYVNKNSAASDATAHNGTLYLRSDSYELSPKLIVVASNNLSSTRAGPHHHTSLQSWT